MPTIDLDATQAVVYGRRKQGAGRSRLGGMAYNSYVATWAQRGRALTSELGAATTRGSPRAESRADRQAGRLSLLPAEHAPATFRIDSAYYQVELLERLRRERSRFTVSVPRNQAMWRKLADIPDDAWADALDMPGAQVAETGYRPDAWKHEPLRLIVRRVPFTAAQIAKRHGSRRIKTIHPEQLQLALEGKVASVFGYSFILTDIHWQPAVWLEHFHRHRAQIEERLKEAKLGQALRHLPSGDENANRVWLTAALLALNLTALVLRSVPRRRRLRQGAERTPRCAAPQARCGGSCSTSPARIARTGRRTILHLPEGFRHAAVFQATLDAAHALPP